jgi:hypothetical protein
MNDIIFDFKNNFLTSHSKHRDEEVIKVVYPKKKLSTFINIGERTLKMIRVNPIEGLDNLVN